MANKSKETRHLEMLCQQFGVHVDYFRDLADSALQYYGYNWSVLMKLEDKPETLNKLYEAVKIIGSRKQTYTKEELERSFGYLSRAGLLQVFVNEAVRVAREQLLTKPDPIYDAILDYFYFSKNPGSEYDFYDSIHISRPVMYVKKREILVAVGIAIVEYSAVQAMKSLEEWA